MTDRLRKLDSLFAEKVLGLNPCKCKSPLTDDCGIDPDIRECSTCYGDRIGIYTRSLDAAWEATNNGWCCRQVNGDFNFIYAAEVVRHHGHGDHEKFTAQAEGHPAEALVLACLRAVGVDPDGE